MSRLYVSRGDAGRAHPGLRLDRFLALDPKDTEWSEVAGQKLDYPAYRLAYQRWERHWSQDAPLNRVILKGRVRGRLAIGLGAKGVLEVGLRLSHTYGAPLIPASSIKGVLLRSIPEKTADERRSREGKKSLLGEFLFGEQDKMGFAVFQDAWWIPEPKPPLAIDVITVHHPHYYADKGALPSDNDNPNPVHFLSVRGSFLFVADAPNANWKGYLEKLLTTTLETQGVGAKTAAGYGRFQMGV